MPWFPNVSSKSAECRIRFCCTRSKNREPMSYTIGRPRYTSTPCRICAEWPSTASTPRSIKAQASLLIYSDGCCDQFSPQWGEAMTRSAPCRAVSMTGRSRLTTGGRRGGGRGWRGGLASLVARRGAEGFGAANTLGFGVETHGKTQTQAHGQGDAEETLHYRLSLGCWNYARHLARQPRGRLVIECFGLLLFAQRYGLGAATYRHNNSSSGPQRSCRRRKARNSAASSSGWRSQWMKLRR